MFQENFKMYRKSKHENPNKCFLGLMVLISLSRCAYSKHCFGNGVCRVVENGQEHYEGSPEEVAKYLKEQDAEKKHQAQLQQRYNEAPKRGVTGKARVALFLPRGTNDELAKLSGKYYTMLKNALSGDARIELVDQGLAEPVLEDVTRPSFASSLSDQKRPLWSQDYVTALRNKGFFADVVVFTELSPKPLVGFLGDGKTEVDSFLLRQSNFEAVLLLFININSTNFKLSERARIL